MSTKPLSDVSVLELSTMIAAPYAGQLLGDLGADVVKIERPDGGEFARDLEPSLDGESFYYLTTNRNKRSLALDITTDEGRELFLDLAAEVDIILENFPPSFTDNYGIDYNTVRERNEDIIYCGISAYGETGPFRTEPGIDMTIQALSGAISMTSENEKDQGVRSGVPMNDVFAAQYAVQGILVSLLNREWGDGGGEFIDVSLLDAGIAGLTTRAMYSLTAEEPYPPIGERHNYLAPEGIYEVMDGHVQISVVTDRHWKSFCEVIDKPKLATDERFENINSRVDNHDTLDEKLESILAEWTVDDLVKALRKAGIPAAQINDTRSVWSHPQVKARDMRKKLEHPTAGTVDTLGFPIKYRNIDTAIERHPPLLGEHTEEFLRDAGYDDEEIEALAKEGIVAVDK